MKIQLLADAEAEIESARKYLNQQARVLGERFLDDLERTLDRIADHPESFARVETLNDEFPYRRALLKTFRYAVIFEIVADAVLIIAVAHTSRQPNYWLRRLR